MPGRLRLALCSLVAVGALPVGAAQAAIPMGVYGNEARFDRLTGQRSQSGLIFLGWDQGRTWGAKYSVFLGSLGERPHVALHPEARGRMLTPSAIAIGRGDAHLIGLAHAIADAGKPVLIRPLAEMNNSKNPYCAFTPGGSSRGSAYSTHWYRRAFQRIYVLMHGGTAQAMSAKLQALRMPGVSVDVPVNPYPNMTVVWNPLAVGVPDVRGNHYRDYFPGPRYLDAYGNNYYNTSGVYAFHRTTGLYRAYPWQAVRVPRVGADGRRSGVRSRVRHFRPDAQAGAGSSASTTVPQAVRTTWAGSPEVWPLTGGTSCRCPASRRLRRSAGSPGTPSDRPTTTRPRRRHGRARRPAPPSPVARVTGRGSDVRPAAARLHGRGTGSRRVHVDRHAVGMRRPPLRARRDRVAAVEGGRVVCRQRRRVAALVGVDRPETPDREASRVEPAEHGDDVSCDVGANDDRRRSGPCRRSPNAAAERV